MDASARHDAPGEFVTLSHGVTHYQWMGADDGPVAVCVHGLTTPSYVWTAVAEGLGQMGYRVLVYDHYGRGYSDRPDVPQDGAFFSAHLNELLDALGVEDDLMLFGYSMGGAVVTHFAATCPDRVRHVVLLAPAGMGHKLQGAQGILMRSRFLSDWLILVRYRRLLRAGIEAERALPSQVPGIQDYQLKQLAFRGFLPAVASSLRGIIFQDFEPFHRAIAAAGKPVLAIWGADDAVIPIAAKPVLEGWNPKARHVVIDGAGHGLPYTHSAEVIATLQSELPPP